MKALYKMFCKAELAICGTGLVLLVTMIFMSAVLRFFRVPMAWNIDLAMLLLAWTSFLGADVAYRSGQLVGIDLFVRKLPDQAKKIIQIIVYVCIFILLCIIGYYGVRLAMFEKLRTFQSIPVPYSVVTFSLIVTAISMCVTTLIRLRECFLHFNKPGLPELADLG